VGPVATAVEELKNTAVEPKEVSVMTLPSDATDTTPLNIGIVGFGTFGQFLATRFNKDKHHVSCLDQVDKVRYENLFSWDYSAMPLTNFC
jgi:hypothetical protein